MTVCTEEPEKVAILIIDELLDVIGQACVPLAAADASFPATSIQGIPAFRDFKIRDPLHFVILFLA